MGAGMPHGENERRHPARDVEAAMASPDAGQFTEILNKSLNAVLVHRDGRPLYINKAYADLHGYACLADAMARHTVGVTNVHPDDYGIIADRIAARIRGDERSSRYEFRLVRPDGSVVWVECLASRIVWDGESALLGIYHDITDRKRAEDALQRSERLFSTVFMNSPDIMVLSTLTEGTILDVNEPFLRSRGLRREEVLGRTGLELGLWDSPEIRLQLVEALRRSERVADVPHQVTLPSGEVRDLSLCAELLQVNGEELILYVSRDVTERRRAEARVAHMAHHDPLTGLANRALFQQRLEEAVHGEEPFALLCVDLDRFKEVNDTHGHPIGDALLCRVAARLRGNALPGDVVARLGGDEFALIQRGGKQPETALGTARRIVERLGAAFEVAGHSVEVAASVGIAIGGRDGHDAVELLRAADLALYRAKRLGHGAIVEFRPTIAHEAEARMRLEQDLRNALLRQEFELHYQPLFDLRSGARLGFEALLRWSHPRRGLLLPDQFIALAEETGLIIPIGEWVLHEACRAAAAWPDDYKLAVNVSAAQLRDCKLVRKVQAALLDSGLPAQRLELEVTESVVLQDCEEAASALHALKHMGVSLALDDFGTGYSSLSALARLPFDRVKIDRSFIAGLGQRDDCAAIVRAVTSLCNALGLATTAEGVETAEQLALVTAEGCKEVQGYLLGHPAGADQFPAAPRAPLRKVAAA